MKAPRRDAAAQALTRDLVVCSRDSIIYAAHCARLGGQVAVKVYDKARTSASKLRAIKREAAMMVYLSKKRSPPPRRAARVSDASSVVPS